jgi:hypothetical protein
VLISALYGLFSLLHFILSCTNPVSCFYRHKPRALTPCPGPLSRLWLHHMAYIPHTGYYWYSVPTFTLTSGIIADARCSSFLDHTPQTQPKTTPHPPESMQATFSRSAYNKVATDPFPPEIWNNVLRIEYRFNPHSWKRPEKWRYFNMITLSKAWAILICALSYDVVCTDY